MVYLQRTGAYQSHLATITEAISFVVKEKFNYQGEISRTSKDYEVRFLSIESADPIVNFVTVGLYFGGLLLFGGSNELGSK